MVSSERATSAPVVPGFLNGRPKQLLIGGVWCDPVSGTAIESINPSTGEVIAQIGAGGAADVDHAIRAAREAFEGPWSRFSAARRQDMLLAFADLVERHYDELNLLDVLDMGRPLGPGVTASATLPVRTLRFYAGAAQAIHGQTLSNSVAARFSYTVKEPVGVVGAITPWNGPLQAVLWKIAPALATGCTVVLKPAEDASLSALRLAELMQELDLPPGVMNVVTGYGNTAGAAIAAHPGVDKIAFTGSTETGRAIVRASTGNLKRVSLELGGKSPNIVFADADLDAAAVGAAMGIFANSGQICVAGSRLFVERSIVDEMTERVTAIATELRVGNSLDRTTQIGPVVSARQLERIVGYIDAGQQEGASLAAGGERLVDGAYADGYFVPPTVFSDVRDDMRIAREEIFGPVVSVFAFDSVDEVVSRANRTDYGLAAGVWTTNLARAHRMSQALQSGSVWVNTYGNFDPVVPFGGYKASGWGREFGLESLDDYLNTKSVWMSTASPGFDF
jgi:aldehyde dehydrogenase (NAD+)